MLWFFIHNCVIAVFKPIHPLQVTCHEHFELTSTASCRHNIIPVSTSDSFCALSVSKIKENVFSLNVSLVSMLFYFHHLFYLTKCVCYMYEIALYKCYTSHSTLTSRISTWLYTSSVV